MLPSLTSDWIEVVAAHVQLAVRRARSEEVAGAAAESVAAGLLEVSRRTAAHGTAVISKLVERFGLSAEEELAAWVLICSQLDPRLSASLESLSGAVEVTHGALAAIAYAASPATAISELSGHGRLFRYLLVEPIVDPHVPQPSWSRRMVRATERLLGLGLMAQDDPVHAIELRGLHVPPAATPAMDALAVSTGVIAECRRAMHASRVIVVATGSPGLGRRSLLAAAAAEAGIEVLAIDARRLAREPAQLVSQVRVLARECKLLARVPLLANVDALHDEALDRIRVLEGELVPLLDGLVLATTGGAGPKLRWDRPAIEVELGQPSSSQRADIWHQALGQGTRTDAEILAEAYPLAPALIRAAADASLARAGGVPLQPDDIAAGIRTVLDARLGSFAKRVTVTQTWEDLVLPTDHLEAIAGLLARVRERRRVYEEWGFAAKIGKGLGVSALFSGPPGTGKTMVAGLIARALGLELYQVDVSKIVSKWIGETEKNLAALFDAAEAGHAVLLFDEADALFGKRTDVKSSNDRHANAETNYLLQRLESFHGICLLTSNHEVSIDPAFQRRLSLHVRFELPAAEERARIWEAMLPECAPVASSLDVPGLAQRFAVSGGHIRNAVLRATFVAASAGSPITAELLRDAARQESESMGRIVAL